MNKPSVLLAKLLTYSGTLPLIAGAGAAYFPVNGVDSIGDATAYGAVIIAFLCGIHWAVYLFFAEKCPRNLFLTSNAMALFAWGSLLLAPPWLALLLQIVCFGYLLYVDSLLHRAGILPAWFYRLRRNATIIVVLSIALIIGAI